MEQIKAFQPGIYFWAKRANTIEKLDGRHFFGKPPTKVTQTMPIMPLPVGLGSFLNQGNPYQ